MVNIWYIYIYGELHGSYSVYIPTYMNMLISVTIYLYVWMYVDKPQYMLYNIWARVKYMLIYVIICKLTYVDMC